MIAAAFLIMLAVYLGCGLLFAVPFAWRQVESIDPHAVDGSWGFRFLILPGSIALWPWLLHRRLAGTKGPPEQKTAHRLRAKQGAIP